VPDLVSPARRPETSGALTGYTKSGRKYRPPLQSYANTQANDWVTDDLPDLLWPLVEVQRKGDRAAKSIRVAQDSVITALEGSPLLENQGFAFDGRLTSIEAIPIDARRTVLEAFKKHSRFRHLIGPNTVGVLQLYPSAPGRWLLVDPWLDEEGIPDEEESKNILREAIAITVQDRHLNAVVKSPTLSWRILRGTVSFSDSEMVEGLAGWPTVEPTRDHGDAFILSSFLVMKQPQMDRPEGVEAETERLAWAQEFWNSNWRLAPCISPYEGGDDPVEAPSEPFATGAAVGARTKEAAESPVEPAVMAEVNADAWSDAATADEPEAEPRETVGQLRDRLVSELDDVYGAFMVRAFDPELPVDLYDPVRHEVVCGLVKRIFHLGLKLLMNPSLWGADSACGFMRAHAETEICLTWMGKQPGDSGFTKYKDYGLGRRILMRRHMEKMVADMPEEARADLGHILKLFESKTGGDWAEQFQDVSIETTFAGISLRKMAEEADLIGRYNHVFQSASGVLHGEWWAIEDYEMTHCLEPLHRWHQIPSIGENVDVSIGFGQYLVMIVGQTAELGMALLERAEP
jgi:hypothetical protein